MKFIRNLTIIETSNATKLENQTQYLVEQFMEHRNWRNKWKLIVIMPNIEVHFFLLTFQLDVNLNKLNRIR